jgi:hypothetical protein
MKGYTNMLTQIDARSYYVADMEEWVIGIVSFDTNAECWYNIEYCGYTNKPDQIDLNEAILAHKKGWKKGNKDTNSKWI